MMKPAEWRISGLAFSRAIVLCGLLLALPVQATDSLNTLVTQWSLAKHSDGVQVYLGTIPGSAIKAVKTVMTVPQATGLVHWVVNNPSLRPRWQTYCESVVVHKKMSDHAALWYARYDPPWPVGDRDMLSKVSWSKDPASDVVQIKARTVVGDMPEASGYTRVKHSRSRWTLTPTASGGTRIEVLSHSEPDTPVPNWLINRFLVPTPYQSFLKLKKLLQAEADLQKKLYP